MKNVLLLFLSLTASALFGQPALRLDSTITFIGYNIFNFPGQTADTTPLARSVYAYPNPDTQVEVNSEYQIGTWITQNRTTLTKDDQGRLTGAFGELYDAGAQAFIPDSRLSSYPRGNSATLIDSFLVERWNVDVQSWEPVFETRNVFDAQDLLKEAYSTFYGFGDNIEIKEVYTYDVNGDNTLIESFAVIAGFSFPSGKSELTYVDHKPVEVIAYVYDGANFAQTSRITYAYTPFDSIRRVSSFEWDIENQYWAETQIDEYDYYPDQSLQSRHSVFYEDNGVITRERIVYEYVDNTSDLRVENIYLIDPSTGQFYLDGRKYYYYNGITALPATPRRVESLALSPNPSAGAVQTSLPDDAWFTIYGSGGQRLSTQRLQPGETLDLSAYPAGLYRVVAQDGDKVFVGSVVKE